MVFLGIESRDYGDDVVFWVELEIFSGFNLFDGGCKQAGIEGVVGDMEAGWVESQGVGHGIGDCL